MVDPHGNGDGHNGAEGYYIQLSDASTISGLSIKTLRRAISAGRLRGFRPTGSSRGVILLSRRDVIAWVEGSAIETMASLGSVKR